MTICTKHSYGGPHACPYCELDQLRAALATAQKEAKRCAEGWDTAGLSLATALHESAEVIAQRDTALGLCKERERELDVAIENRKMAARHYVEIERELAETRKALDNAMSILSSRDEIAEAALESTRAELARSEARVKELRTALHQAWKERAVLPSHVVEEIRTVLRG